MAVRRSVNGFIWSDIVNGVNEVVAIAEPAFFNGKCRGSVTNWTSPTSARPWTGGARPDWFKGARLGLIQKAARTRGTLLNWRGEMIPIFECELCGLPSTSQGLQVDHIGPWRAFLQAWTPAGGALTNAEAKILYSYPGNLRVLCAYCNGSHPEGKAVAQMTRGSVQARSIAAMTATFGDAFE